MRLLITGASGLLGLNLALEAMKNHQVVGLDRSSLAGVPFQVVQADLLEDDAMEKALDLVQPGWVIHCAALANLEACEAQPVLASRLNARLPGEIALACRERGIRMVYISTDAVFGGDKPGLYTEEDAPDPLSMYASTKLQGEKAVLSADPHALVARVNFYGFSLGGKRSLAEFFLNNLMSGKPVKGFTDLKFNPTFVGDLADMLLGMLAQGLHGVYHTVSAQAMSKYDFGVELARRFHLEERLISPDSIDRSDLTARRAHNLGLSVHKLSTALAGVFPSFSTGLERFYTQFQQGYPQKIQAYQQQAGDDTLPRGGSHGV